MKYKSHLKIALVVLIGLLPFGFGSQSEAVASPKSQVVAQGVIKNRVTEPTSSLVTFSSAGAKQQFMTRNGLKASQLKFKPKLGVYEVSKKVAQVAAVSGAVVQENHIYQAKQIANDGFYSQQYALPHINAPTAWDTSTGSASVTIAVIDTGFGLDHEDLADKWTTNSGEMGATASEGPAPNCTSRSLALDKSCNNLDDDSNGFTDDWRGWNFESDTNDVSAGQENTAGAAVDHGTLTSSEAAASTNNTLGMAGACWGCHILPLKVLDDSGSGTTTSVAEAVHYAADRGASVINMSLGGPADPLLESAVNYALAAGAVIVAASGNSSLSSIDYPANYPGVIAVAASDQTDLAAGFSNIADGVVFAPGVHILSADWAVSNQTNRYAYSSGTSMASAIVSGAVGVLRSQFPASSATSIKSAIYASSTHVSHGGLSYPFLNMAEAMGTLGSTPTLDPVYRLANFITHERLFTTDANEKNTINGHGGWVYENVAFNVSRSDTVPTYRLANFITHERLFTNDGNEKASIDGHGGWVYENVAFSTSGTATSEVVYRLANFITHERLFTTDANEKSSINGHGGWVYEGIGFYAH